MNDIRMKIAAGATILGLGGLAGYAVSSNGAIDPTAVTSPAVAKTRPKVHTQTIRRTIHVRPHRQASDPAVAAGATEAAPAELAAPSSAGSPQQSPPPQALTSTPVSAPEPVSTRTSGGASGGATYSEQDEHEQEHEGVESELGDD